MALKTWLHFTVQRVKRDFSNDAQSADPNMHELLVGLHCKKCTCDFVNFSIQSKSLGNIIAHCRWFLLSLRIS